MGTVVYKTFCPRCRSRGEDTRGDNMVVYDNNSGYCFACNLAEDLVDPNRPKAEYNAHSKRRITSMSESEYNPSIVKSDRGITVSTFERYGVMVTDTQHFYPYRNAHGEVISCMIRDANKQFTFEPRYPDASKSVWGKEIFPKGSSQSIIITEGQLDAMSAYQMLSGRVPCVSLPTGASSVKNMLSNRENYDYFNSFDTVYLCFDNDKPGKEAISAFAESFETGKIKLITLPADAKDANDLLYKVNRPAEFTRLYNNAKYWVPSGIICSDSFYEDYDDDDELTDSIPYPWEGLNDFTYGIRKGELITVCAGCVDKDTEFLTPTGWKPMDEYKDGDLVAQYDKDTTSMTFVRPLAYIKEPAEMLWHIKTKYGVDQVLSEEHRILSVSADGVKSVNTLTEVMAKHSTHVTGFRGLIPTTFVGGSSGSVMSNEQIRLMTAVIADGHFPSNTNSCVIRIKKERKKLRLVTLLDNAGISYTRKECAPYGGFERFTFVSPFRVKEATPELFWTMSYDQLLVFTDEVLHWDGCITQSSFSTRVPITADFVQYAFSSVGKRARVTYSDRGDKGVDINVQITDNPYVSFRKTNSSSPEFVPYKTLDGYKYCFSVPTGFLVLRRNGNIFVTGNSGLGKTSILKEVLMHIFKTQPEEKVGIIFLEENYKKTRNSLASIHKGVPLHLPSRTPLSDKEKEERRALKKEAYADLFKSGRFFFYNHFGSSAIDKICTDVRYLSMVMGCKYIFLDHISILVSSGENGNEREALDQAMTKLRTIVEETNTCLFLVSHLKRVEEGHENGAEIQANHLRGSGGIMQLSDFVIGLERNNQEDNPIKRNTTKVRVIKNRLFGETGLACGLYFDKSKWSFSEVPLDKLLDKDYGKTLAEMDDVSDEEVTKIGKWNPTPSEDSAS